MSRPQLRVLVIAGLFFLGFLILPVALEGKDSHRTIMEGVFLVAALGLWLIGPVWVAASAPKPDAGVESPALYWGGRWLLYWLEITLIMAIVTFLFAMLGLAVSGIGRF